MKHLIDFKNFGYDINEALYTPPPPPPPAITQTIQNTNQNQMNTIKFSDAFDLFSHTKINTKDAEKAIKNLEEKGFEIDFAEKAKFIRNFERQSGSVELKFYEFSIGNKSVAGLTSTQYIKQNKLNSNQTVLMIHKNGGKAVLIYF